jgi:hypothetical protein
MSRTLSAKKAAALVLTLTLTGCCHPWFRGDRCCCEPPPCCQPCCPTTAGAVAPVPAAVPAAPVPVVPAQPQWQRPCCQ